MKEQFTSAIEDAIQSQHDLSQFVRDIRPMFSDEDADVVADALQNIEVLSRLTINELEFLYETIKDDDDET